MAAIDYQRALALRSKGFSFKQIAREMSVNPDSLKVGFARKGLTKLVSKVNESALMKSLKGRSEHVRDAFGQALERDVACMLTQQPALTPKEMQMRYDAVESTVRIASKVFGWEAGSAGSPGHTFTQLNLNVAAQPEPGLGTSALPIDVNVAPASESEPVIEPPAT